MEVKLGLKIALLLVFIELGGILVAYFTTNTISLPALKGLNASIISMNNSANGIGTALNYTFIQPIRNIEGQQIWDFATINDSFATIGNIIIYLINLLAKIIYFVIEIFFFIVSAIGLLIYVMFTFIPSILLNSNLGLFGTIFGIGYAAIFIVIGFYALRLISSLISVVAGVVR